MRTLYIDRKGAELSVAAGRLTVRMANSTKPFSLPLAVLERVVVSAGVEFSSTLLHQLSLAKVTVVFLNPRNQQASCMTYGFFHNDAARRLTQYKAISQPETVLNYSRQLVLAKLRGQKLTLLRAKKRRLDLRLPLSTGIGALEQILLKAEEANTIDALRGHEGAGAAAYFKALQSLFAPSLAFNGRNRRPPLDPVNVVLSLSYTLLHAEAVRALIAQGFDPHLGIFHLPSFGRESLACDLVELYRSVIDRWVWRQFAEQSLRLEHFAFSEVTGQPPCLLGKAGRAIFYAQYELQARAVRKSMRKTTKLWTQRLQQDFPMQWQPLTDNEIEPYDN